MSRIKLEVSSRNNMKTHLTEEIQTTPELEQRIKNDAKIITALSFLIAFGFVVYVVMSLVDVKGLIV